MKARFSRKGAPMYGFNRAEFFLRLLPYGIWKCADGREILFDRDYAPICQRYHGQTPKMADHHEFVPFTEQRWLWDDGVTPPARKAIGLLTLDEWGMRDAVIEDIETRWKVTSPPTI